MWDIPLGIIVHSQASYALLPMHFSYSLQTANAAMSTWWFPRRGVRLLCQVRCSVDIRILVVSHLDPPVLYSSQQVRTLTQLLKPSESRVCGCKSTLLQTNEFISKNAWGHQAVQLPEDAAKLN